MGALDSAFRAVASSLVGTFSDTASTLTRTTMTYDPLSGEERVDTVTESVLTTPPEDYSLGDIARASAVGDSASLIQQGDFRVYVAAADLSTFVPPVAATDTLTRPDGRVYKILGVSSVWSGDSVALYELRCRR